MLHKSRYVKLMKKIYVEIIYVAIHSQRMETFVRPEYLCQAMYLDIAKKFRSVKHRVKE